MNPADALRDLLVNPPPPGKDLVWLGDEFLTLAQHTGSLVAEISRAEDGSRSLVCSFDGPTPGRTVFTQRSATYLFRPLLARLAKLGSDETGAEFDPYHTRYTLARSSRDGAVRLEVAIENTPAVQRVQITRKLVGLVPAPAGVTGATAEPGPAAQPTA